MTTELTSPAVVVVGGGIAGVAACLALRNAGHFPLWLAPAHAEDWFPFGESLSPAAYHALDRLGVANLLSCSAHRRSNLVFSAWGGGLFERNEDMGWVLDRRRFELELRSAGIAAVGGLEAALLKSEPEGVGWRLHLSNGCEFFARFLIDATGRSARIGSKLASYQRVDRLVGVTSILNYGDPSVEPTPATLIEAIETGWWYAALLPDGRLALAYFSDPDLLPRGLSRNLSAWKTLIDKTHYVSRWIRDAGFSVDSTPRLLSASTTYLDPPAGQTSGGAAWAATGDAALALDPLSSYGMTTALWMGTKAGETASDWLAGKHATMNEYVATVRTGLTAFLNQRQAYYANERRFAGSIFWSRRLDEQKR